MGEVAALGIHVAAQAVWFAAVSAQGDLINEGLDRLALGGGELSEHRALSELEESLEGVLDELKPRTVGLLQAGTSNRPTRTGPVRGRALVEAAVMIACAKKGHDLRTISHPAVKKAVGMAPTADGFREEMSRRLVSGPPPRWADRAPAYAAGLAAKDLDV